MKQELHTENEETTVIEAVLEADIERVTLLRDEKEITARLEGRGEDNDNKQSEEETVEERKKKLIKTAEEDKEFSQDLERLNTIYDRLTLLGADTAKSRATAILSGLQFTEPMKVAPIKSLSGGWRMRVALAAALLIEPDILMLGKFFARKVKIALPTYDRASKPRIDWNDHVLFRFVQRFPFLSNNRCIYFR